MRGRRLRAAAGPLCVVGLTALLASSIARADSSHDFELYDLGDRLISLAKLRAGAKLVVVDFFSEICKPCREALPAWRRLHQRYAARGLAVVVVAVPGGEDREAARRQLEQILRETPVPFPVVWDKYTRVAKQYKVVRDGAVQVPQVFLLSGAGALVKRGTATAPIAAEIAKRLGP